MALEVMLILEIGKHLLEIGLDEPETTEETEELYCSHCGARIK